MINKSVINDVLFEALKLGGDFAEIFLENKVNNGFQMVEGKVEKGLRGRDFGIGIRIYVDDNSIYTYTNDVTKDNLIKMVRSSVYLLKEENKKNIKFNIVKSDIAKTIIDPINVKDSDKIELMQRAYEAASNYDQIISQVIVNYSDYRQDVLIANTDGLFVEDQRIRTNLSINSTATYNGDKQNGNISKGAHMGFEFYEGLDIEALGREASRMAKTIVKAEYAPSGTMPVVIDNGFGGVLFHEACGHGLEATSVAKGISVYSNKIGEKIASSLVTAIDDGTIENAWGSQKYDDEGNLTQKNILIENGILKSYLIDRLNGKIMNKKSSGSGRRESYKFEPTSRMTNTYIDNGESTFEEIISDTEYGIYAKYLGGGSVNTATGQFNFAVKEGYIIRNGKIEEPVRGATLIGTGSEILKDIDMVANNLEYAQGACGSISGTVPVNVGQPTLRIKKIIVGGRSEEE